MQFVHATITPTLDFSAEKFTSHPRQLLLFVVSPNPKFLWVVPTGPARSFTIKRYRMITSFCDGFACSKVFASVRCAQTDPLQSSRIRKTYLVSARAEIFGKIFDLFWNSSEIETMGGRSLFFFIYDS